MNFQPTADECNRRSEVLATILEDIKADRTIKLPDFDARNPHPSDIALFPTPSTQNSYNGTVYDYRYQFEGEEDLLHLIVTRIDETEISVEEGQATASFVFNGVPTALIWMRPGKFSQHYFVGHDDLIGALVL